MTLTGFEVVVLHGRLRVNNFSTVDSFIFCSRYCRGSS